LLSPSNATYDLKNKFELYQRTGVTDYWILDPISQTAVAYTLLDGQYVEMGRGADDDVVRFQPFKDLKIPLGKLWRKPKSK
jgi:Uma2 family endonuclease